MKHILLALLLTIFSSFVIAHDVISLKESSTLYLPVIKVKDGDTIETRFTLPPPLDKVSVRIRGIDTPEKPAKSYRETGKLGRAKCFYEAEMALTAKQFVVDLIKASGNVIKVTNYKYGKYGARFIGTVYAGNVNIGDALVANQLAIPYNGGTKTYDWCSDN